MTIIDFLLSIVASDQVRILVGLIVGNLVLGVVAAVMSNTFTLVKLSDYARTRLLPVFAVYSVGALVSWAAPSDPVIGHVRDLVFGTESAVLIGLLLANLRDFGITIPSALAGPLVAPSSVAIDGQQTGGKVEITGANVPMGINIQPGPSTATVGSSPRFNIDPPVDVPFVKPPPPLPPA